MGWCDIPSAEETEIQKFPHQDNGDNFFDSQGAVHKGFAPEGKAENAEFCKGVMHRLPKSIHWVHPAAFCFRDFFLFHDNPPAQKAANVCQFLTPKNVITLYHPSYSTVLSL